MNRLSASLCLGLSAFAAALACFALVQSTPDSARTEAARQEPLRELHLAVDSLRERLEALEAVRTLPAPRASAPRKQAAERSRPAPADPAGLEERVEELTRRLASLEDGETIARLAESGKEQAVHRELEIALDRIGDPEADPQARLEALGSLRGLRKQHWPLVASALKENEITEGDIVMPLLELAQDQRVEPELRAEVLTSLESKLPELRQPLIDLFAYEESPEVRRGSLHALMWHLGDANVRELIRRSSQEDRHESIRATALKYLPKVEHFDRQAAEAERAAVRGASGQPVSKGDK